ncbi:MAG TPA: sulfatase-like hydrolase/transferase [Anaerolineae bacterium]|nr:sulfatase-like hydrolase/transferase [Anaerolineae bacterium]
MVLPDVFFIVLDTQRADRLGCYGYDRAHTPHLDQFAKESALFKQAVSPAQWTIPSHASLFSGLYPTAHQVIQSDRRLTTNIPHLAEVMSLAGYDTVAFCNNPLVGVLDNGLQRGFQQFYNYGGAAPQPPAIADRWPWPLNLANQAYNQLLGHIATPIQNFVGRSDWAFQLSLNRWLTPIWSKMANFKGQNERSVADLSLFLNDHEQQAATSPQKPLFLFLNLMETHLPFWPPAKHMDRINPQLRSDPAARDIIRQWNREAYRWPMPLPEPLPKLEAQVLSDMYDAEVTYQDDYLGQLFTTLKNRRNAHNTLTVIVGDHGDGLGEHQYMGHAFVAYEELLHVPLLLHWPAQIQPTKIDTAVSTRRVFHTICSVAGDLPTGIPQLDYQGIERLSLLETITGEDPEDGTAYGEVYPPLNFVRAIEKRAPSLIEPFRCTSVRRAVVRDNWKLIRVDEQPDELFDLTTDPAEIANKLSHEVAQGATLNQTIHKKTAELQWQQDQLSTGQEIGVDNDEQLLERLRGLGYID